MASDTRIRQSKTAAAFTLVELLLSVSLMLLLAGVVIINFGSLDRNARLEEGAGHMETLFRYARAQAASTGRRVQIVFGPDAPASFSTINSTNPTPSLSSGNPGVQILWEPNPVEAPGRFESMPGAEMLIDQVNDLVKVQEVHAPGYSPSGASPVDSNPPPAAFTLTSATTSAPIMDLATVSQPPLNCYPDGSSDSLEVTLASANGEDKRLAVVSLSGLNGSARHRMVSTNDDTTLPSGECSPSQRDK